MQISPELVRGLLRRGRIFVGRGTSNLEDTGLGLPAQSMIKIQRGIRLEPYTTFWSKSGSSLVSMGAFSYTHSVLSNLISVGRYTSIAKGLRVQGASHPTTWVSTSPVFYNHKTMMSAYQADHAVSLEPASYTPEKQRIAIGNDVWIGEHVTLAKGIRIADGAVIASNATVTRDVESYTIIGGLPAQLIKRRFPDEVVELLQASRWWDYDPKSFMGLDLTSPRGFAAAVIKAAEEGLIAPYTPSILTYQDFQAANQSG